MVQMVGPSITTPTDCKRALVLLLLTGSLDGTSDRIISKLGNRAFRFNFDLYKDYDLAFTPEGWTIRNPAGHSISSKNITSAFWWKAFNYYLLDQDKFIVEEVKYVFRELYNWCQLRGLAKGNAHDFHNRLGKMNLLHIAARYFQIPKTLATFRLAGVSDFHDGRTVAKSFSSGLTVTNRALMTTEVDPKSLDPNFPWYLQERVDSDADITIFICGNKHFSYERDRSALKGLDWRTEQSTDPSVKEWARFDLSEEESSAIKSFCRDIDVSWGRLDLMRTKEGLVFLEYNANGQWVFLDYSGEVGLVDHVANYLTQ